MGQLLKAKKYTFLYLLALNIKIKPEKQDKNKFQIKSLCIFCSKNLKRIKKKFKKHQKKKCLKIIFILFLRLYFNV